MAARGYDETVSPLVRLAGVKMRERRQLLNLTMQDVMLRTQGLVTSNFVSALETGRSGQDITFYRLALLGEVYGLTPLEMYELFGMGNILNELGLANTRYRLIIPEEGG